MLVLTYWCRRYLSISVLHICLLRDFPVVWFNLLEHYPWRQTQCPRQRKDANLVYRSRAICLLLTSHFRLPEDRRCYNLLFRVYVREMFLLVCLGFRHFSALVIMFASSERVRHAVRLVLITCLKREGLFQWHENFFLSSLLPFWFLHSAMLNPWLHSLFFQFQGNCHLYPSEFISASSLVNVDRWAVQLLSGIRG